MKDLIQKLRTCPAGLLIVLFVCTCLGILPNSTAQQQTEENPELVALCEELVRICDSQNRAGGVAIVKRAGHTELVRAFQMSPDKIDEQMGFGPQVLSVKPDTIFPLSYLSTTITSVAALTFVEEGVLSLKDPLAKYLPEFANPVVGSWDIVGNLQSTRPAIQEILIEHLLTQTSGLIESPQEAIPAGILYEPPSGQAQGTRIRLKYTRDQARRIAQLPLIFDPGCQWHLGCSADVLGAVLEEISGQNLSEILDSRVFTPLGMKDTAFRVPSEKRQRVPPAIVRASLGSTYPFLIVLPEVDLSVLHPDGPPAYYLGAKCLHSTAGDCVRFCEMLLGGGQREGVRILSEELLREAMTDRISRLHHRSELRQGGFGLGFALVTEKNAGSTLGSAGTSYAAGDQDFGLLVDHDQELIVVLLNAITVGYRGEQRDSLWPMLRRGVFQVFPPRTAR